MFTIIQHFILKQLLIIHYGVWYAKLKSSFILGATFSPLAIIIEKFTSWYIANQLTIFFLVGAVLLDWILGVWKHLKLKTFSWKKNSIGFLVKIGMVVAGSYLTIALTHFLGDNMFSNSIITVLMLSIFMYPAGSCWMNMSVISNGAFPPAAWIDKIKSFDKNLNINDLANGKSSETN